MSPSNKGHLFFILLISGFYFLYAEVLWQRILKLLLGSSTLSNSVVLIAIMCGLSAGYLLYMYLLKRVEGFSLLKIVLPAKIIVTFLTVIMLRYIDFYKLISRFIDPGDPDNIKIIAFNYVFALIITIIPCILAGMIIPAVQSFFPIEGFSFTYLLYNLGAVIGGFFSAFYSFRYFGLYAGFYGISALLFVYAVLFQFIKQRPEGEKETKFSGNSIIPPEHNFSISFNLRLLTLFIFTLGFSSLAFQALYFRVITVIVSNTTYSFSTIVLVYIAGISAGSYIAKRFPLKNTLSILKPLLALIFYVIILNLLLQQFGGLYIYVSRLLADYSLRTVISVFILSGLLLFFPSVCLNMLFVYLTQLIGYKKHDRDPVSISLFYSTLGSVFGIITATFIFIPYIGISRSLMLLALIFTAGAMIFIKRFHARFALSGLMTAILLLLIFFSAKILPPSVFRMEHRDDRLLYYKETSHGNVSVIEDQNTGLLAAYVDNNAVIGTAYDAIKTVHMLGFLPLLYNPYPSDILVIGFGMGVTSGVLGTAVTGSINSVEIVPYIFKAAEYFNDHNFRILENPRLRKIAMDGRIYMNYSEEHFDIISCDPTHPLLGSNALYTLEYFRLCSQRLSEKGIMTQYLPMHFLSNRSFQSILKNFSSVFDDMSIWLSYTHLVILGRKGRTDLDFQNLRSIDIRVRQQMRHFGITDLASLLSNYICDRETLLDNLSDGIPHNRDSDPFVEFDTFFDREEEFRKNINFILSLRSVPEHLIGDANPDKVILAYRAKEYMIKALVLEREGRIKEAADMVEEGLNIYSGDIEMRNYLFLLKSFL